MDNNMPELSSNSANGGSLVDTPEGYLKCIEVINLILDGEADHDTLSFFEQRIKCCQKSMKFYDLEKNLKEVIRQKIEHKDVPIELLLKIKEQINQKNNLEGNNC